MLRNIIVITFALFFVIGNINAQQLHNPISNFGFGDFLDNEQTMVNTTGWANNTFSDRYHVNFSNAASYANLQSTSFEIGINAKNTTLSNGISDYKYWSGQLSHLSLAFPVFSPYNELLEKKDRKVHWGMGIALSPYSQVSYNYQFITEDPTVGKVLNGQSGSGGTYKLAYNNGISYKNFSFGIGAQYIFGKIERSRLLSFNDFATSFANVTSLESEIYAKGLLLNFSGMYHHVFNPMTNGKKTDYDKEKKLTIGASFQPMAKMQSSISSVDYVYSSQLGTGITDTIRTLNSNRSSNKFNSTYGMGVSYQNGAKWKINLNYDAALFENYAVKGLEADYKNTGVIKLGGEWCPEPNSYGSFLKRSKYRLAFKTGTLPLNINDKQATVVAGTLGYGFPVFVNRQISHVNIGIEAGKKTYGNNFDEKYIKLQVGFNLNDDLWFLKRKFD